MFTLVIVLFVLALVYFYMNRPSTPDNIPPMPLKPYPIVGHLPYLKCGPRIMFNKWKDEVGNIFSIYMGGKLVVVLNGYDLIKEALVKQADVFSDRPAPVQVHEFPDVVDGMVFSNGETWKEQRSVSLSILRDFGMGKNSLAEKISEEAEQYLIALGKLKEEPANVKNLTNNCVSNIICSIILGKRFELDDPEFLHLLESLAENSRVITVAQVVNLFPILRYLPGDPFKYKRILELYVEIREFLSERFVKPVFENPDKIEHESFVSEYRKEMNKRVELGKPTKMNEVTLNRNLHSFFVAGTETTSTTMLWFFLYMLHHPDVLTKVYEEIKDVVGSERAPSMKDKPKLNYLNATIMETQRIASIAPFSVPRMTSQTTTLQGYTIPKGTTIMPSLDSVLLDEKVWKEPKNFRPERFLDDDGALKRFDEFIPFSFGRRDCIGKELAKMELFLFLSATCQRFDIRPAEEGKLPSADGSKGIIGISPPFEVRFIERKK